MVEQGAVRKPSSKGGCFRTGCFGCLGVLLLAVILPLAYAFIEMARGVPVLQRETESRSQILPGTHDTALPDMPPPGSVMAAVAPGHVKVDFSTGQFTIKAGPPGQPIRVEADYDTGTYELVEEYTSQGELGWSYSVRFRPKVSWLRMLLAGGQGQENSITLILPRGTPMELSGSLGVGESNLDLGGLWLTRVSLNIGIGEHKVRFDEPLPQPMEELRLDSSIGEVKVVRIGNASPRKVILEHSLGEASYDLRGEWVVDSEVEVACGIGECNVRLPGSDVNVDLVRASVTVGDQRAPDPARLARAGPDAPTIRVDATGILGELSVDD
jgi:hypothetical protein